MNDQLNQNIPRNHHYLSQCYLKWFTIDLSTKSKLYVFDLKKKTKFETRPRNVGAIRDFNLVEDNSIKPNYIENMYSKIEEKVASSIKKLNETLKFEGDVKDYILYFIAIIGSRSPERRETWRKFNEDISKKTLAISLSNEEIWNSQLEMMKEDGIIIDDSFSYKNMKEFQKTARYRIDLPKAEYISIELEMIETILPYLYGRKWRLIKTDEDIGTFITSDNPMVLTWNNYKDIGRPAFYGPGHGLVDTRIYFPVSKYIALIGEFNNEEGVFVGNEKVVAYLNSLNIWYTYKQVYTDRTSFKFINKEGNVIRGEYLFDHYLKK